MLRSWIYFKVRNFHGFAFFGLFREIFSSAKVYFREIFNFFRIFRFFKSFSGDIFGNINYSIIWLDYNKNKNKKSTVIEIDWKYTNNKKINFFFKCLKFKVSWRLNVR